MQTFEWRSLQKTDPDHLRAAREQLHQAIQNVAAVGRKFSPKSRYDEYAVLTWVPGLSRLAGQWVSGSVTFRSSLSLESFTIYLVDQKVNVLGSYPVEGQTQLQMMIWLEEQIGKLGLNAANLTMNLPYELPEYPTQSGEPFHMQYPAAALELAKYYHNSYVSLREIKVRMGVENNIQVWPHHFDQALEVVLKNSGDPETDTHILLGMSPGDHLFGSPYFYVSTWPFTDTSQCGRLSNNAIWVSEEWTGAVLFSKHLFDGDQKAILDLFYEEASAQLIELLTK
ncbi:hypothetical protein [Marinoscillum sp. 108]|uniref:hypothetical protein n=1 Tax=Marinoscillum sp. 108 TaxID=2653151 RepID=UPI0012F1CD28|nr:hypothetical protein [Marinoscillum sp. 108]VXD18455.1 conserved hypothetical protein [Marinoscillum sp. 108]